MFFRPFLACAAILLITGCDERAEVVVTESRPLTTRDAKPMLFATSDQRFRNTQPSPVTGEAPQHWLALPATQFRLLNYRFGESGLGEVWVSISSGGVLANVNRWLGQMGRPGVTDEQLAAMPSVLMAGGQAVWVEATGAYAGMGAQPKSGFAMAGALATVDGRLLTVKMVGPQAEVADEVPVLKEFARSLELKD